MDTLPIDLQYQVLSYLDEHDVLSLRQVLKTWVATTSEIVFSKYSLMCFAWTLDNFRNLSKSSVAQYVKELTIITNHIEVVKDQGEFESQHLRKEVPMCTCLPDIRGWVHRLPKPQWKDAWPTYQALLEEQAKVFNGSGYLEELKASIARLPNLQSLEIVSRDFEVLNQYEPMKLSWTTDKVSSALAREVSSVMCNYYWKEDSRVTSFVLDGIVARAASSSNQHLRELNIDQRYNSSWKLSQDVQPMLDHIEVLRLTTQMDYNLDYPQQDRLLNSLKEDLSTLLGCPNVREVAFCPTGWPSMHDTSYIKMLIARKWSSLRKLSLGIAASTDDLVLMLGEHGQTLKDLEMNRCCVDNAADLLEAIPDKLHLNVIKIKDLWEEPQNQSRFTRNYFFNEGIDGDEQAQSWLRGLSDWEPEWEPFVDESRRGCETLCEDVVLDEEAPY